MKIPTQLAQSVRARWPDRADHWLTHLEPELTELCQRFSATPQRILPARYALVIAANTPDGSLIMRATADPDADAQTTVAKALAQLDIGPAIHATSTTDTGTWTVMDQVKPGTPLADADPNTLDLVKLTAPIRAMASAPPPGDELPSIADWLRNRLSDDHLTDLPPRRDHSTKHRTHLCSPCTR
jgi:streptomycin 6-kinase